MGEQGVHERAENAPMWGLRIRWVEMLPILTTWWRPFRKSRTQLHRAGLRPKVPSLMMSLEGTMVNTEL